MEDSERADSPEARVPDRAASSAVPESPEGAASRRAKKPAARRKSEATAKEHSSRKQLKDKNTKQSESKPEKGKVTKKSKGKQTDVRDSLDGGTHTAVVEGNAEEQDEAKPSAQTAAVGQEFEEPEFPLPGSSVEVSSC